MGEGIWKCNKPDCGKQWMARVRQPTYCPNCKTRNISKMMDDIDSTHLGGEPVASNENTSQQSWGRETARDDDREYVEAPVAKDVTRVIDPMDDFINMLSDFGIKTKKQTMAKIFFNGDIDEPEWMDRVLKEGGIDMARRRLAIMRWYGHTPEELQVRIKPGPTEKTKTKSRKSAEEESEDDIDKLYKDMKLQEIRELKEEVQERKLRAMKEKLGKDDKSDKESKGSSPGEHLIEIPLTNPNTGAMMLDKENRPIMMKVTPQQYFFMQQNQMLAQVNKSEKSDEPTAWEKQMVEDSKYWRDMSMKLLTKDDGDKYMKLVMQQSEEREKFLKGVYDLREQILRKEVKELGESIKGPDEWYKTILYYTGLGQKMGLVQGDPKHMVQQQVTAQVLDRMNDMQQDGRILLQEGINMMRAQQQRQIQGGAASQSQVEAQRPLTEEEKQYFYMKGAEDYKKAIEAQIGGQQQPQPEPDSQQPVSPPTTGVPPPPSSSAPPSEPSPAPPQPEPSSAPPYPEPPQPEPSSAHPQEPSQAEMSYEPPRSIEEGGGHEVQLGTDSAEVPPPPIDVHVPERPVVSEQSKSAGAAEKQVQRWSAESPIDSILSHPLEEPEEKKTTRWSESE